MTIIDKLRAIIGTLPDDGSREVAKQWESIVTDAAEMSELLANPTFKKLVESVEAEMRKRLNDLVSQDPELKAMRNLLIRTTGLVVSRERVEHAIEAYLQGADL